MTDGTFGASQGRKDRDVMLSCVDTGAD
jgi:hypothetical protein